MSWAALFVRCALGAIFVYAGTVKLRSLDAFAARVTAFDLLPSPAAGIAASSLPLFELLLGLLLLSGWQRRAAAFSALVLTSLFAAALLSAIARGLVLDCGCFGDAPPSKGGMWIALARDGLLVAAAAWLYWKESARAAQTPGR